MPWGKGSIRPAPSTFVSMLTFGVADGFELRSIEWQGGLTAVSRMPDPAERADSGEGVASDDSVDQPRRRMDLGSGVSASDAARVTLADREATSTSQLSASLGSRPSTVATEIGTVVFSESDRGDARNTWEREVFGIGNSTPRKAIGHISGLSRGRRIDLIIKYRADCRPIDRPMTGTRGPWNADTDLRSIRLLSTHREAVRPQGRLRFEVTSEDGVRKYLVVAEDDGWSCDCEFWQDRRTPCKHIVAVVRWLDPDPPRYQSELPADRSPRLRHTDWPTYDKAQQIEHLEFDKLLWNLLSVVPERLTPLGRRGRRPVSLRTQILMAVRKVHLKHPSREAWGLITQLNEAGGGFLGKVPNYSVPCRFLNTGSSTAILTRLIEYSGSVLREIEDDEPVAIDSSGFSTSTRGSYFTEHYAPERRHRFVKAHLAVGVKTHAVLSARITDEHGADSPLFLPLLRSVVGTGRQPTSVVADKAYLSRANLEGADALGVNPFIPFKVNSRGHSNGAHMWNRKYHEFLSRRDEFDAAYHKRSNVETVFSAIKQKLGEPLLSRTELARLNETLAKVVAYNVWKVIFHSTRLGLDPGPLAMRHRPRPPPDAAAEVAA